MELCSNRAQVSGRPYNHLVRAFSKALQNPSANGSCAHTAIFGVPGYIHKGIHRELRKSRGKRVEDFVKAARTAEGIEDWDKSTEAERERVVAFWHEVQAELGNAGTPIHSKK